MNRIINEIEIFIHIIETRSRVIIIPSVGLILGLVIYFFIENNILNNLDSSTMFYPIAEKIINKRLNVLFLFIFSSSIYLFCLLYIRERKRY